MDNQMVKREKSYQYSCSKSKEPNKKIKPGKREREGRNNKGFGFVVERKHLFLFHQILTST